MFYPLIFKIGKNPNDEHEIFEMDVQFQLAAREAGFCTWDKFYNEIYNVWSGVGFERNYMNKYVNKSYETNLISCKF